MFEIGASLREARTRRGLSLDDVTTGLRIRERYVTALEEERWELMPAEAYTKGFLRMYAEFLGLNGTLYIDEYNERIAPHDDEPFVPESLAPEKTRHRFLFRTIIGVAGGRRGRRRAQSLRRRRRDGGDARRERGASPRLPLRYSDPSRRRGRRPTVAQIRAVTSRSWLSVRIGDANGKEIFRGFLNPVTPSGTACARTCGSASAGRRRSRFGSARTSSAACPARRRTCC